MKSPRFTTLAQFALPLKLIGAWVGGLLLSAFVADTAWASTSMRCEKRIVGEGDHVAELLAACGSPALKDRWLFEPLNRGGNGAETELWTYDFGPNQLLRLVKLRDDRVVEIETDGYGYPNGELRCRPSDVHEGVSKYRIYRRCGEPLTRRSENALRPLPSHPNIYADSSDGRQPLANHYVTPVYREEWVYNFGPSAPMRRIIFEDGWITYVEMLDRGFTPR